MTAPVGAHYCIVKNTDWLEDDEDDWLLGFHSGQEVYFRIEQNKLLVWSKNKWTPTHRQIKDLDIYCWQASPLLTYGPELKEVIGEDRMAEVTVKIAKVLRDSGIDECRYNESLNCLQYVLVKDYLDEWAGKPAASQSGAADYWDAAHKRAGIERPRGPRHSKT